MSALALTVSLRHQGLMNGGEDVVARRERNEEREGDCPEAQSEKRQHLPERHAFFVITTRTSRQRGPILYDRAFPYWAAARLGVI